MLFLEEKGLTGYANTPTAVPGTLLLIACFLTIMFYKVVRQHMEGLVEV